MIEQISNHTEIAIDQLLAQFKEKPRIEAMVAMQTDQIQDLENAAFEIYVGRSLQTATGATLDRWGNLLAEPRYGKDDENYRAALFFKITRNIARGTPEDLISIFGVLTGATQVKFKEEYPATVFLIGLGVSESIDMDVVLPYVKAACPAGVKLGAITYLPSESAFGFLGYPSDFLSTFGDISNPLIGGYLADGIFA